MYKIVVEQLGASCPEISRWCLDSPLEEGKVSLSDLETVGVLFQGWVLPHGPAMPAPFVRVQEKSHHYALNVNRPDVVEKILAETAADHALLKCGFHFHIPLAARDVIFGFRIGDRDFDCARLRVQGEMKVLEGEDGYLFLDNDTNRSVDQFTGKLLLNYWSLRRWSHYLDKVASAALKIAAQHAVLIVPSKELVLNKFHPYQKGRKTPVEQVIARARACHHLVCPVVALRESEERTFRLMDTHVTNYGAMLIVLEVLKTLGVALAPVREAFDRDTYSEREVSGDLGNKFYPPRTAREKMLTSFGYRKKVVYDNTLPNVGRVVALRNAEALGEAKCLVFGASSTFSMLPYLVRVFSEVVFIHSSGNVDVGLMEFEKPDYIISQTNGRFVIRPPVVGYDLGADIQAKMKSLPDAEKLAVVLRSERFLQELDGTKFQYYHDMLLEGIEGGVRSDDTFDWNCQGNNPCPR